MIIYYPLTVFYNNNNAPQTFCIVIFLSNGLVFALYYNNAQIVLTVLLLPTTYMYISIEAKPSLSTLHSSLSGVTSWLMKSEPSKPCTILTKSIRATPSKHWQHES